MATGLLAEALAESVSGGAVMAGLGVFDQGFYDRVGFATTPYERWLSFDPADLIVSDKMPVPKRLSAEDVPMVHRCRLNRLRMHGSVNLFPENITGADMVWAKNGFGLGYDGDKGLATAVWFSTDEPESGPYTVWWSAFSRHEDFRKVLGILSMLSDQVKLVKMREPPCFQIQDYLDKPLRRQEMSKGGKLEQRGRSVAYHQIRICNLERAIEAFSAPGNPNPVRFNLTVSDPVDRYLSTGPSRRGCGGEYTVTLGSESTIQDGHTTGLDTLESDIGTFTRLWAGVLTPRVLAVSGRLKAPLKLLESLEELIRFPSPSPDWEY